ncbi:uncharacterized protein LOC6577432 [Drosophila mojavensis]|uniref:Uncharacterized protein n=1 Tax=Drosophila mojavensis TaxID=7230 RepID=B4KLG0_DROMO|nr:uncharacterized protein LOC6577432 [Drosophila mojavensis]EDW12841.1 uncharacterized protein Dmoj_GI22748 [Drosophila mojavensis]
MNLTHLSNLLMDPIKRTSVPNGQAWSQPWIGGVRTAVGTGYASQMQQVRRHMPVCGPPRFRLSTGKKIILGWIPHVLMLSVPFWALSQMPRWSAMHNNRPYGDDE